MSIWPFVGDSGVSGVVSRPFGSPRVSGLVALNGGLCVDERVMFADRGPASFQA